MKAMQAPRGAALAGGPPAARRAPRRKAMLAGLVAMALMGICGSGARAQGEQHGPKATEVRVELSTPDGAMRFVPGRLRYERSTYHKLVIHTKLDSN